MALLDYSISEQESAGAMEHCGIGEDEGSIVKLMGMSFLGLFELRLGYLDRAIRSLRIRLVLPQEAPLETFV